MGNQKYMNYGKDGRLVSHETCYQYRCGWDTGVSFIHAIREKHRSTYFCINYPSGARERIRAIFQHKDRRHILHRDFFLDTLVADDSLKQWQLEIGQRRVMLLSIEKTLEKPSTDGWASTTNPEEYTSSRNNNKDNAPSVLKSFYKYEKRDIEQQPGDTATGPRKVDTEQFWREQLLMSFGNPENPQEIDFDKATRHLHKMVRHWLGLRQDCEDLLAQLKFLQNTYRKFKERRGRDWVFDRRADAEESFEVLISQCDVCVRWTQVYLDRTQLRINMLFHLANQQTAADTARIAEQTQRDSASMITIAAVTMLFLPGTFICAILSTTFFDFGEAALQVSSQWWVLPAATIPLTVAVFGIWWGWQQLRRQRQLRKVTKTKVQLQKSAMNM
ncbi:hypothetical protein C7974DRAFT_416821 [Boeremia exigua]|uniref:uncharacterized protein n=1 Tax=Boeremia exigua TaxID=749465 RepID=UPI001E8DB5DF|nr:uncharacterized protein C7974DRAFT_416821 [Boeremia exigua]KAH6616704.1 hypothetical protein C7974DRAFT_416821 [Boeremia exigua]